MPIVRIEMLIGRSPELKSRVAAEVTAVVARLCNSDPAHIYVVFNDVQHHDWAVSGQVFTAPATGDAAASRKQPRARRATPRAKTGARSAKVAL